MITIRKGEPEDASDIIDFQRKMALETEQLALDFEVITKGVNAVFENPAHGQYWVAEDNGKVVASLMITYEWSDWRNTNVWWFQSVYIIPDYRRKGIFRSMYSSIKKEADRQCVTGLRLYVESNNSRAQKTYEAMGMKNGHYLLYEWFSE
jgi:GNAT superfamily N-acetyltransferase